MASAKRNLEAAGQALFEAKAKLTEAQEEVERAQRHWDEAVKAITSGARRTGPEDEDPSESPDGLKARILAHLIVNPGAQNYNAITKALCAKSGTVRSMLNRLKGAGKVEKVGRGLWQAVKPAPVGKKTP